MKRLIIATLFPAVAMLTACSDEPEPAPEPKVETVKYEFIPYKIFDGDKAHDSLVLRIAIMPDAKNVNQVNLAATCVGAANYYGTANKSKSVFVVVHDDIYDKSVQLARCSTQNDKVTEVFAAERTTTDEEKKINYLWWSMRDNYQKNGETDSDALKKAISAKIGKKADEIYLPLFSPDKLDHRAYQLIRAMDQVK